MTENDLKETRKNLLLPILEQKQVRNDSTSPASRRKNSKKLVKNPKGNKNGEEESSSPDVPSGSSKKLAQTLKRKKRDNDYSASSDAPLSTEKSKGIKKDTPVSASSKPTFGSSKKPALVMKDKEEGSSDVSSHIFPSASAKESPCTLERKNGNNFSDLIGLELTFNRKEAEDSTEDEFIVRVGETSEAPYKDQRELEMVQEEAAMGE
ncbi:hypothetical protein F3Y22_tig00110482pilonHSYRG00428 [Hibiscus syriacus]|uniref:Uncharacterized protein n=1 Tax=Hibiscus syriacus TaxID=106335 RepID=A0A6A3ADN3_HIBSY|nr:hypothetical protein F3Y22_tig00110482pilonHSYRG00428 [Hibiscus syriacus]